VIDEGLKKARMVAPDDIPPLTVPPPKTRKSGVGTIYFYPLPQEWGVDGRVAPNAGLSRDVAALSVSLDQTERLLKETPLKLEGPLHNVGRPLASAAYFSFAALVDAVTPWIEYAIKLAEDEGAGDDEEEDETGTDPSSMMSSVVEVLKCFRGYSSATSFEDGAKVTHYEWHFADLP